MNYETEWKKAEKALKDGNPKTALEGIERIYQDALKYKEEAQQIKALVYKSQIIESTEEDSWFKNIKMMESAIKNAPEPSKQILYSLIADLYLNYVQENRWKIYDRLQTDNPDPADPETWSIADFNHTINQYYEKSLTNSSLLQKTSLNKYDAIIDKGNVRKLRPALFDLLAHKALDYWKNDESDISKPVFAFELNDQACLAPCKIFIRQTYTSQDTTSHTLKAIKLFQELIAFHSEKDNLDALIDVDIERVQFVKEKGVMTGKDQLYKEALDHIYTTYSNNEQAMKAGYLLANWWKEKGDVYDPKTGTSEGKMAYKVALEYAEKVSAKFPKSEGAIYAGNLMAEIKKPSLSILVEQVNIPEKPFRASVEFKEVSTLFLRLVKIPNNNTEEIPDYENEDSFWKRITGLNPIKSWKQKLPTMDDFRNHRVEIKMDGLEKGHYMVIASKDEGFMVGKNPMSGTEFYISNIGNVNTGEHYFILERDNGQPLAGAKIQAWFSRYDYNKRKNILLKGNAYQADKNGYFQIKEVQADKQYSGEMRLEISTPNDYLFLDNTLPRVYKEVEIKPTSNRQYQDDHSAYYIFTDRSIYRPGQTIFFKSIGLTKDQSSGKAILYKPENVQVVLRNASYEEVSKKTLQPNDFGSISGDFLLPETGLTGSFTVEVKVGNRNWQQQISVEEYKRPQFSVSFLPIKSTYKLNRDITVSGSAKGYAGNNIDGASVAYKVTRTIRFLYPWRMGFNRYNPYPPIEFGNEMEIAHGTSKTDAEGNFDIHFTALPDLNINKEIDPVFDFTIEASVTDINGETRSEETQVSVGYKSLELSVDIKNGVLQTIDSVLHVGVNAKNLNGEAQNAKVAISVFSLKSPNRLIRKRYWQAPDTAALTEQEFIQLFPNDPFRNEDEFQHWETKQLLISASISSQSDGEYTIPKGKLSPGHYRIEATAKDMDGQEVKTIEYLTIIDPAHSILGDPDYSYTFAQKTKAEPGESAVYWSGSSVEKSFIIQQTEKRPLNNPDNQSNSTFEYINQKTGFTSYSFAAKETDRGGYMVRRVMMYHNRIFSQNWMIDVPWDDKELNITLNTFRNKLLPGARETWKVTIKGNKGEKAVAEMLAGMYDASLDQFMQHKWQAINPWISNNFYSNWNLNHGFGASRGREKYIYENHQGFKKTYDELISMANRYRGHRMMLRGASSLMSNMVANDEVMVSAAADSAPSAPPGKMEEKSLGIPLQESEKLTPSVIKEDITKTEGDKSVQIRKNFNETAFFLPDLQTAPDGSISFSFTMPEALTQWKLQLLAHTKDARFAYATQSLVTQKDLMVMPNPPRFFRQGDEMELSVKVSNLTNKEITGQIELQLINATTMQPVDGWFRNVFPNQYFTANANQSVAVKFPIEIPFLYNDAVMYRIVAKSGELSDGEEMALPVLTNKTLVTESFPINMRGTGTKTFTWQRFKTLLAPENKNESLQNKSLTVEYTTNPAWYAIQSLPYLMEYPYDCAEQTWNRYFANALAGNMANKMPKIKAVFESWKNENKEALMSNLQKNQELKSIILEETPWVLEAKNEAQQKRNLGLLFDMVKMQTESDKALNKLIELQSPNGGFVWFKGGRDDRYMTQYILTGMGHLKKLNAWPENQSQKLNQIVAKAIPYLDERIKEDFDALIKQKLSKDQSGLSSFTAQYLYMRSFFPNIKMASNATKAVAFYKEKAVEYWTKMPKLEQGLLALSFFRDGNVQTANAIIKSLTEFSIQSEEFGMYWKEFNNPSGYWWQAPIESHALLIEAFSEIEKNQKKVDDLKTWLLKQKQTTNWKTTKATAEACYALLFEGSNWLVADPEVTIDLGNYKISGKQNKQDAGTGYFKQVVPEEKIIPDMGNIKIQVGDSDSKNNNPDSGTSWGAVYWQYFEDLDKITYAETGTKIKKDLYIIRNTDMGQKLELLKDGQKLKVGDRIKVRMEIKCDRQLEYVHIKDLRASCFEPVNVLSSYKYQGGLGYYETTKDASSNFFISYLPKGTWVFEYELRTTHSGNFSNGITSLQCMYAPEFSSHSNGIRVQVD